MASSWARSVSSDLLSDALEAFVGEVADLGTRRGGGPKANTVAAYRTQARRVAEMMPGARVSEVTPRQVTAMYRRLLAPPDRGGRGLAPGTVAGLHWFLCAAFRWMVRQGMCAATPMADVDHPTAPRAPGAAARALDESQAGALSRWAALELSRGSAWDRRKAMALAVRLGLCTGMRAGEVAGLLRGERRAAVPDLLVSGTVVERGGLHRQPTPKRDRVRRVAVDRADDDLVAAALAEQGDLGPEGPIVTVTGGLTRPSALNAALRAACAEIGLPSWVHFHTLRHTHATLLLLSGVSLNVVSERLGHADVATTLRLYGHVLPGRDLEAAREFGRMLGTA